MTKEIVVGWMGGVHAGQVCSQYAVVLLELAFAFIAWVQLAVP